MTVVAFSRGGRLNLCKHGVGLLKKGKQVENDLEGGSFDLLISLMIL